MTYEKACSCTLINSYRGTVAKSRAVKQRNALDLFEQQVNQEQKQKLQQELHIALNHLFAIGYEIHVSDDTVLVCSGVY